MEGFWFSACGVDVGSTAKSVSKTCVLAETDASNSTAWVAVSWRDNTGGGGVLAWGSRHAPWQNKEATLQLVTVRNSSWNGVTLCDLFPFLEPKFLAEILPKQLLTLRTGVSNLAPTS